MTIVDLIGLDSYRETYLHKVMPHWMYKMSTTGLWTEIMERSDVFEECIGFDIYNSDIAGEILGFKSNNNNRKPKTRNGIIEEYGSQLYKIANIAKALEIQYQYYENMHAEYLLHQTELLFGTVLKQLADIIEKDYPEIAKTNSKKYADEVKSNMAELASGWECNWAAPTTT